MRRGMVLTAAAGPFSNVVLAVICSIAYGLFIRFGREETLAGGASALLGTTIVMNIGLAVFNMLPIPPLDGSRVVDGLMPARWERTWEKYCQYGPWLLLFVIAAPRVLDVSILGWPLEQINRVAWGLVGLVAGDGPRADLN
jgi:Zn-dependent protease